MTVSVDLRDKLLKELDCLTDMVEGQLPCLAAFNLVLDYDGADSDWYAGVKQRTKEIQQMIADDRAKIAAIHVLLETDSDTPPATFTAKAAKDHTASKVTRKSLRANLDATEIADIRARAADGESYNDLGAAFCVSRGTIGNIIQRKGCYSE